MNKSIELKDGSQIAVIGGGPAGSFFAYFALDFAERYGMDIGVDIIEGKDFNCAGPTGCNHCGGIVSESLIQSLSTEGIILPSNVIRRGIESYTMHLEQGSTVIETPLNEQRIASMFRGLGPRGIKDNEQLSFDNYLMELSHQKGATLISGRVTETKKTPDGIVLKTKDGFEKKYDLVVGAVGLNARTFKLFQQINPSFVPPKTTKTHICEFHLGKDMINEYFGNSMHVFLLNLPNIKFGALIPKGNYVTMVLLGSDINKEIVAAFLESEPVRSCFPEDIDLNDYMPCQCYPSINILGAKSAFDDRMILIGDSASSKLYKNGIGAAYITAKAAARTAIFEGVSKHDFKKHYQPVCNELDRDNIIGKFIFLVTTVIQKSPILKKGLLRMVVKEQKKEKNKRYMSSVLWDTFTGSAPYTDIFKRTLNPILIKNLIGNTFSGLIIGTKSK
ncbi:MAG: hypothetical protein C0591_11385 [Marinilabiliales bacterium]|nr:MAG: hypothetical protein C0591_11385 [Marinilabiliales bacterium]